MMNKKNSARLYLSRDLVSRVIKLDLNCDSKPLEELFQRYHPNIPREEITRTVQEFLPGIKTNLEGYIKPTVIELGTYALEEVVSSIENRLIKR